jgi:predicted amidohydrolase
MRLAHPSDAASISRLIEMEEAQPFSGDSLVAEQDGTIIAAVSLADGRAVADLFQATAGIVRTLRQWRAELVEPRRAAHVGLLQRSWRVSLYRAGAWT